MERVWEMGASRGALLTKIETTTTMIHKLLKLAAKNMLNPLRITPRCHPNSPVEVYLDSKKKKVVICCAKCERTITRVSPRVRQQVNKLKKLAFSKNGKGKHKSDYS